MSTKERKNFFGDKISEYFGDLNAIHGGLSYINNHLTHIEELTFREARGFYLGRTGRKIPFFALKDGDKVGVGCSYGHAADALLYQQVRGISEEQRIAEFVSQHKSGELYTVESLWNWHRRLTGACYGGGEKFLEKYNLEKNDLHSVQYFILITENDFGGDVIHKLKPYYFEEGDPQTLDDIQV